MKIEYAVQMTCDSCVQKVQKALSGLDGISKLDIDLASGTVMVDTVLSQSIIKDKIEETGMRAVLKGYGQLGAAVAMLGGNTGFSAGNIKGVIRFVQEDESHCIIDGEIETTNHSNKSPLSINIYECGDISNNCTNVGDKLLAIFQNTSKQKVNETTLDSVKTPLPTKTHGESVNLKTPSESISVKTPDTTIQETPNGLIVKTKNKLDLASIIGRSVVIEDDARNRLACAVIARSAGIMQNKKSICACDGVTIWEERDRPLAGPGRRAKGD